MSGKTTPVDAIPEATSTPTVAAVVTPPATVVAHPATVVAPPAPVVAPPAVVVPVNRRRSSVSAEQLSDLSAEQAAPRNNGAIPKVHRRGSASQRRRSSVVDDVAAAADDDDVPNTSSSTSRVNGRRWVEYEMPTSASTPRVNGYYPMTGRAPSLAPSTLEQLRLSPCSTTSTTPTRPTSFPRLTPGTSPSPSPALSTDAILVDEEAALVAVEPADDALLKPPGPSPAASGFSVSPSSTCTRRGSRGRRRSSQPGGDRDQGDRLLGAFGMPFLFPGAAIPMRQEMEEQQARLSEWTLELNSQIATFRELMLSIGSGKDTQQLREDVRKCRMATMELCRNARPLIAASHKWAQPGGWTYTMTPAAMWCEFMKMFHRQLGTCYILVHEFPADMSGYQGGALSKLLVQSLRPEWNKQEIASVRVDLVELQECITATGVVTPDDEQQMESSTALQKPELQRRRSALSFMFCCSRDSNRSPPPPPEPTSSVQDLPDQPTSSGSSSNSGNNNSSANNNNNNSSANNKPLNEVNQEEEEEDEEGAEARPYDPCTPWDSM
ncbi:uncharacterized protein LOC113202597 isoform X3 [Frankliniella occidentalis]|uniref:Uncharacterized protein LOC113202597 isoform X3 n=1 Tax=Frankliniella occidentalis TaxID=133901 RepID=A0A6J1RWH1_FRAOC|nr:uncharacterized protein LOC113202597 isoform X3 [Frankliniella occidentalis]